MSAEPPVESSTPGPAADDDGTPPPAPGPASTATEPTGQRDYSLLDQISDRIAPGTKDLPPWKRVKPLTAVLIAGVILTVSALTATLYWDIRTAEPRVAAEENARQKHDQAKPPFTARITYDNVPYGFWRIVLDRPLTAEEQETLQATRLEEMWQFLQPLGARLLRYPSEGSLAAPGSNRDTRAIDSKVFTMNIVSDRTTQLSIIDMHAVNVSCHPSTAQTVIDYPPEGGAPYEGVAFDLTQDDPIPYITDGGVPEQGRPYFSQRKIDLGGGMAPGGLRVEAVVGEESCEWEIEATYHDSTPQGGGKVILRDGDKPFFAEARPRHPAQYWLVGHVDSATGPMRLIPCHTMPTVPACQDRYGAVR